MTTTIDTHTLLNYEVLLKNNFYGEIDLQVKQYQANFTQKQLF
jgi:hypothetical protein